MEIWVTYVPPLQRFFPTVFLSFNWVMDIWASFRSKAQIEEWVRYRYLSTYSLSEFLSHRSSLFFPFYLDGRKNWLQGWTKMISKQPPLQGSILKLLSSFGQMGSINNQKNWLRYRYLAYRSLLLGFFPAAYLFSHPFCRPGGGIHCRSWQRLWM